MDFIKTLLSDHQVRKTAGQKEAFRQWLLPQLKKMGYLVYEESVTGGAVNVIAGEPAKAKFLLTAHYDTCPKMPVPNFITPFAPIPYFAYQALLALGIFVLCALLSLVIGFVIQQPKLVMLLLYLLLAAALILLITGPANPHTANDNTSGVATLLEIAAALPPKLRKQTAIIFFDKEERGLAGSRGYKRKHAKELDGQTVINFDCVGDGDYLLLMPSKHSRWDGELLDALSEAYQNTDKKQFCLRTQGNVVFPSDHRSFKYHVAVAAAKPIKLVGYYIDRIHTAKDTVLDEENVSVLRDATIRFLEIATTDKGEKQNADL